MIQLTLLDNYPGEIKTHVHRKTFSQMFKAALFIIAQNCKQSKFLSIGKWIIIYPYDRIPFNN